MRIDGELHVRSAGFDAYFADDGRSGVAHALIFLVGQRLRGGHGDGVAGVNAHGIEVLDRADDHEVVAEIAHDLELEFLPAKHGLLDQRLVDGAEVQRVRDRFGKFFLVVGDGAAGAAKRERRPNNQGKAQLVAKAQCVFRVVHQCGRGNFEADLAASVLEPQAVFGHLDGAQRCADHFHFVFFEDAGFRELDGQIQCRLPANRGQ